MKAIFIFPSYNDPYLNRFLQPDTIIPSLYNPQSLNRYSFVGNNPINYSDPTGHWRTEDTGSRNGCYDPKYCSNGIPNLPKPLGATDKGHGSSNKLNFNSCSNGYYTGCNGDNGSGIGATSPNLDYCHGSNACYEARKPPSNWNLNPENPDYYTFTVNGELLTGTITADRYGQYYIGGGINVGKSILLPTISLTQGYIGSQFDSAKDMESQANIGDFLNGLTVNAGGGYIGGASATFSPSTIKYLPVFYSFGRSNPEIAPVAWESGAYLPPGAGISATYSIPLTPLINRMSKYWQFGQ